MAAEPLGQCVARVGQYMPVWAPRRGARCEAAAALLRECSIGGRTVSLPLCVVHERMLERASSNDESIAAAWLPDSVKRR
jgi:hypothetical protein